MHKKLEEVYKEDNETAKEHLEHIKETVADKSYFKDALDWYFFRYVTAICDRTVLIFGGIIAAVVFYFLIQMIQSAFPLVVKEPIFIRATNQSLYFPNLVHLKPKPEEPGYDPNIKTVDQAVAKYLVGSYVSDREEYDFSKAEIEDVNVKFNRIKNLSSEMEYRKFQLFMSKDNPESPINNFGQPVRRTIEVKSINFISKEPKDFASRALVYLTGKIPSEAEVRLVATVTTINENEEMKVEKQPYLVKLSFTFNGVSRPEKDSLNIIKFVVNSYQLFKVK